ncbi:MAG: hypothetical protein IPI31_10855 [Bacteroidetes bacterium]|nr:hypothetical protein [Bacteroidota bacterium]
MLHGIHAKIMEDINLEFSKGGSKLLNTHFENGPNLHSNQYYYIKKYFENLENCSNLSKLLIKKIESFNLPESTTLLGFRSYTSILLNKTINDLGKFNYAILEKSENSFAWQYLPQLKNNIVIILPIACTFSTYIKLRKFILDKIKTLNDYKNISIDFRFINIFLILESELQYTAKPIKIHFNKIHTNENFQKIYHAFNWKIINSDSIIFSNQSTSYSAYPLVTIYSNLFLPEECPLCFPLKNSSDYEKPLLPTSDNYESPNVIFEFPNFKVTELNVDFFDAFSSNDTNLYNIHLYGHIKVRNTSYISYIRGNVFYEKNKIKILDFFSLKIKNFIYSNPEASCITFITIDNKHNSRFLEDLINLDIFHTKQVNILKYIPNEEFIDNFFTLHLDLINEPNNYIIYYEDVISGGKNFKLLNDYLYLYKNSIETTKNKDSIIKSFDLVLSLIDRTSTSSKTEILKSLTFAGSAHAPEDLYLSFFRLNVPIIAATHLGNPIKEKINFYTYLINTISLDSLKHYTYTKMHKFNPISLPEIGFENQVENIIFLYFKNKDLLIDINTFNLYNNYFTKEKYNLLKLFLTHELNNELTNKEYWIHRKEQTNIEGSIEFIDSIIKTVITKAGSQIFLFIVKPSDINSKYRDVESEMNIIVDIFIKLLCRHPFKHYFKIYNSIFQYCVHKLDTILDSINRNSSISFSDLRQLKFYVKRLVDLNSNYLLSDKFFMFIKTQFTNPVKIDIRRNYYTVARNLISNFNANKINAEYYSNCKLILNQKVKQATTFNLFLLLSYKELISKSYSKSLKLEQLINSQLYLPKEIINPDTPEISFKDMFASPYFHFTGSLKSENTLILTELVNWYKYKCKIFGFDTNKNKLFLNFDSLRDLLFKNTRNDPAILNIRKLLNLSRYNTRTKYYLRNNISKVRDSVCSMLILIAELEKKKLNIGLNKSQVKSEKDLNREIKDILDLLIRIIDLEYIKNNINYNFFIKYSNTESKEAYAENIFSLNSTNSNDDFENSKLDKNGLIYNFLIGIKDESNIEQSFIAGIRNENGIFQSFSNVYYTSNKTTKKIVNFSNLIRKDFYNLETSSGIKELETSSMFILVRFSQLKLEKNYNSETNIQGQSVLLVTTNTNPTMNNFIEFVSNEKIRLILLVKNDLIDYFQKQFDNDAFYDLIASKKILSFQKTLRHGLADYIFAQKEIFKAISSKNYTQDDILLYNIVSDAINGQLKAMKVKNTDKLHELNKQNFIKLIALLMETVYLGKQIIDFKEINLKQCNFKFLKIHPSVLEVILPELIINIKKYCPRQGNKSINVIYNEDTNSITLSNLINPAFVNYEHQIGEGIEMCNKLLRKLTMNKLEKKITNNIFSITLYLNI